MAGDSNSRLRRRKRARFARWLRGDGIEIGALYRPLELPQGASARYVDRFDEAGLRDQYPELAKERFVPVSIIGDAEDLSALSEASVDFVVANHLVEHLELPINALREFDRVLRPGGALYLALPDQRAGIDHKRAVTPLDHLLDEHRNGPEPNRHQHYLDWVANAEGLPEQAEERARWLESRDYAIHFHVWRPQDFLEFLLAAFRETGLEFEIVDFGPPEYPGDDEFIVVMLKGRRADIPLRPGGPGRFARAKRRLADSALGPVLKPPYRAARKAVSRLKP